jgi:hypothetical protein
MPICKRLQNGRDIVVSVELFVLGQDVDNMKSIRFQTMMMIISVAVSYAARVQGFSIPS